jgi:hypothetical protein
LNAFITEVEDEKLQKAAFIADEKRKLNQRNWQFVHKF